MPKINLLYPLRQARPVASACKTKATRSMHNFNGATASQPWKCCESAIKTASRDSLQWGSSRWLRC